jgi:Protein of unknown function (DUF3551)
MCKASFGLAVAVGLATSCFFAVGVATADPYKWCALYSGENGGGTNCGFVTIEQCRATISGMGGLCEPNQFYTGPNKGRAKRARKRHRD